MGTAVAELDGRLQRDLRRDLGGEVECDNLDRLVDRILDVDRPGGPLVGVVFGKYVVQFRRPFKYIVLTGIDGCELDGLDSKRIDQAAAPTPEAFVRSHSAGQWTWLHPRYRWIYSDDALW